MSEWSLAKNLRRLRKAIGWSQEKLAQEADVSKSYISMIENGRKESPSSEVLAALSEALKCTPAALYQGVDLGPDDVVLKDLIELAKLVPEEHRKLAVTLLKGMIEDAA